MQAGDGKSFVSVGQFEPEESTRMKRQRVGQKGKRAAKAEYQVLESGSSTKGQGADKQYGVLRRRGNCASSDYAYHPVVLGHSSPSWTKIYGLDWLDMGFLEGDQPLRSAEWNRYGPGGISSGGTCPVEADYRVLHYSVDSIAAVDSRRLAEGVIIRSRIN